MSEGDKQDIIDVDSTSSTEEDGGEEKKGKSKWIYLIVIILVIWFISSLGGNETEDNNTTEKEVEAPKTENIEEKTSETDSLSEGVKEVVIASNYTPENIYGSSANYNKNTFRLALKGEFETAELLVRGKVENDLKNILSVNVGMRSGVYTQKNQEDKEVSAIFDKNTPIDVAIDLKNSDSFAKRQNLNLWNYVQPQPTKDNATVVRVYASVYDQKGAYHDNTKIDELKLRYTCNETTPDCEVVVCGEDSKSGGSCLIEEFGNQSAQNYIDYFTK